uniref:NR LBD domain-containing protein n=1 Tax=Globodera pallida TaxID=36090 RepID=A0A183BNF3_GLOPA
MTNVRAGTHLPEVESAYVGGGVRRGRARRQIDNPEDLDSLETLDRPILSNMVNKMWILNPSSLSLFKTPSTMSVMRTINGANLSLLKMVELNNPERLESLATVRLVIVAGYV